MGFTFEEFPDADYYRSDLRQVLRYIREVVKKINTYDEVIEELKEALEGIQGMDARITALENATADLNTIRATIRDIQTELVTINTQHATDISRLQREIDSLKASVNSFDTQIEAARSYSLYLYMLAKMEWRQDIIDAMHDVNRQIVLLQNDVQFLYQLIADIDTAMVNPWHQDLGRIGPSENNKLVYSDLADECLTAEQYCKLGLSATAYSNRDITAREYAEFGKEKLHFRWVYSPAFGFKQEVSNVLTSIMNAVMDTLTAVEYSALDLSAEEYTLLDMTAYEYYSFMADEGFLKLGKEGITASQYSTIGV